MYNRRDVNWCCRDQRDGPGLARDGLILGATIIIILKKNYVFHLGEFFQFSALKKRTAIEDFPALCEISQTVFCIDLK